MYADDITDSVKNAVEITERRRKLQMSYNKKHNITPKSTFRTLKEKKKELIKYDKNAADLKKMPKDELRMLIKDLEDDMKEAASQLDFERAAKLRDQLIVLKGVAN